jgi:2,4-dienoyl-CoA reductase (NADPH2)
MIDKAGTADPHDRKAEAAGPFPLLFSPLSVGPRILANRIVMLPQGMGYTNRGLVEPRDVEYHRRRASAIAMIITGGTATHPSSQSRQRNFVEAWRPGVVAGLRARSRAVHDEGSLIVGQLFNLGFYMDAESNRSVPLSPGAARAPGLRYAPMAMGGAEVDDVIEGFRRSAANLARSDYDGIEIHGAHGYLLAQFLSAATNKRTDEYGGSAAGRARLLISVARGVRSAIGDDMILGVRLSVDDEVPGGTDAGQCLETINLLRRALRIDYVSLAIGLRGTYVQDSSAPDGIALSRIAAVRNEAGLPVIGSQRIRTPRCAEDALARGDIDLVGLARALIADPEWADKARKGAPKRIRLCVGDVQDCRQHLAGGLQCMVNPDVGAPVVIRHTHRRAGDGDRPVAIIGAGPAGLETAIRLSALGRDVAVFDAHGEPGGQVLKAATAPGRSELLDLIRHQVAELHRAGVDLRLGVTVSEKELALLEDAVLVLATGAVGAELRRPEWLREDTSTAAISTVWETLSATSAGDTQRESIVVLDDGLGDWPVLTAAQQLAVRSRSVVILSAAASIFSGVPAESVAGVKRRLLDSGIDWYGDVRVEELVGSELRVAAGGARSRRFELHANRIVIETGRRSENALLRSMRVRRGSTYAVGDVLAPRTIGIALREAAQLARVIADKRPARSY